MNEWLQDGDNSYYVGEDGAMYTGSHIMDGCLYMFSWNGRLMKDGKQTYSNGVKYVFDGTGRGVPAEMNAEERMRYSASTIWCEMTYEKSTLFRKCVAFCLLGSIPNPLKNLSNLICCLLYTSRRQMMCQVGQKVIVHIKVKVVKILRNV